MPVGIYARKWVSACNLQPYIDPMKPEQNLPAPSTAAPPVASPPRKKRRWILWTLGTMFTLFFVIVASAAVTVWWLQRPIKPVVLSAEEQATVEAKLDQLRTGAEAHERPSADLALRESNELADPTYLPGSKVLTLTDREINGLLNANTEFGENIRFEFGKNAINAYLAVRVPQDAPFAAGRMIRAKGRFSLSLQKGEEPRAVLEDFTVFGLSLPKAWLGGLKGENLLADVMGKTNGTPLFPGIKDLHIKPGALVIEVED